MQKLISGEWVEFDGVLMDGDVYRIPVGGKVINDVLIGNGWDQKTYQTPSEEVTPIEIIITSITGDLMHNSSFTKATAYENTNLTISGTLAIPNQSFAVPIKRNDGRLFIFPAEVIDGAFNAIVNFPTCGAFTYSDDECNKDLPSNTFTVNTINFDILRQITP